MQPSGGYNVVPPPITGNFMPPKPNLVFNIAPLVVESDHSAFNIQLSPANPAQAVTHTTKSMAPIIEDWVSDSEDESEPNDPKSAPSFVQSSEQVKPFGHFAQPIKAPILDHTPKPISSKTNGSRKRKNMKTCFVCRGVDHLIKDYTFHVKPKTHPTPKTYVHRGYDKQYASSTKKYPHKHRVSAVVFTKSKPVSVTAARPVSAAVPKFMAAKPRHARSLYKKTNSFISRHQIPSKFSKTSNSFQKVIVAHAKVVSAAKGKKGNLKGGKITGKGKIKTDFKLPDESQVLLRVPRENNMYNVNLKDIVPSGDLTCLFANATIDESNLWHRRLRHCGYKKDNYELNYKSLNNLQQEWKQYGTLMRKTKNLMDINIHALYNILNQNQGDVNDALGYKKKAVVVTSDPLALVAEKMKVSKRKEKV
nr:ribonuclease H-like domain-containing protein [Tanacetum cinerariifolium]